MKNNSNNQPIPFFRIHSEQEDLRAISKVIESKKNWAVGPEVDEFQHNISSFVRSKYCITFNSGTNALFSALLASGIRPGDEVIVPAFTYIATPMAVQLTGAKPIFADIENLTFGLDPANLENKISKKTKAIVAVHYGGIPCQIELIRKIADKNKLILIEDAAEAFGSSLGSKRMGTFGDFGIFSFSQGKIITTGEGGAVVTNSKKSYDRLKQIIDLGKIETVSPTGKAVDYVGLGYNFRLSNIQAALGNSQITSILKIINSRRKLAEYYKEKLKNISEIKIIHEIKKNNSNYQFFSVLAENRDGLNDFLIKSLIDSKIYFRPAYSYSIFKTKGLNLSMTEKISKKIISLPFFTDISKNEIDIVCEAVSKFYKK
jgi:perosamine synthetase